MFYKMITNARDRWYASNECSATHFIENIVRIGQMRDAQIDAIKTYLFLKIACENQPLASLFYSGKFNSLDLDDLSIPTSLREYLKQHAAAAALFEYAILKDGAGKQVSEKLEAQIRSNPSGIDYYEFFRKVFYGVSYTDYLFSLPMGAGKTFLMAAFIYIDLYFARNEPDNRAFAHNFIILAPSGLKSSVVPSLRTIQNFNPAWIIAEPEASAIKRQLIFEVLDQNKTAKKSNRTKNPNVQRIANHQPLSELFGLVAVTNAEKVILDRIEEKSGQISFFDESDDDKDRQANELRNLIGKLPSLSIFIDEVHHAVSDEIKLRAVVNRWMENQTINSVIGFSGTPYLEKAEKISVVDDLAIKTLEISNVVYYYPLIQGVGNFLKSPIVKISDTTDSTAIVEAGVREFLNEYRNTVYPGGLSAKLAIYCSSIPKLEEVIYPLVKSIAMEYDMPDRAILRFYRESTAKGSKRYKAPADSQMLFDTLDSNLSPIRIILLVQIGKEGWDCRSLTGIILSQEGDCAKNMVLQTSCRCLRQLSRAGAESALIYLNKSNADKLNTQLLQQQHVSLKEFSSVDFTKKTLKRYDRTDHLKLPKIEFIQMRIRYETLVSDAVNPQESISSSTQGAEMTDTTIITTDLSMETLNIKVDDREKGTQIAVFNQWLYSLVKDSFGTLSMYNLTQYEKSLRQVFDTITYEKSGCRYFSSKYDTAVVNTNIRKSFCEKRDFSIKEELIPEYASLLNIKHFTSEIHTDHPQEYYPDEQAVKNIILDDQDKLKISPQVAQLLKLAEEAGQSKFAASIRKQHMSHPQKDRSFHYLPYHTDSNFEQVFLSEILAFSDMEKLNLEVYYNGDRFMTEFQVRCYKKVDSKWIYIGLYTPDFLIIKRENGVIHKAIIVETKGEIYAHDPVFKAKRSFMESDFLLHNNSTYGYTRFDYLYLEDTLPDSERISLTHKKIREFFEEE